MAQLKPVNIAIFSDSICPFCYLGHKKLNNAIASVQAKNLPLTFTTKYRPYQLDPTMTTEPLDKRERYGKKFGQERFEEMEKAMVARGKEVGVNFSYGGKVRQTIDSHRLLEKAYDLGGESSQRKLIEQLFAGYFENEKDIGDHEFLSSAAADAGVMTKDEAQSFLKTEEMLPQVQASIEESHRLGITGVPAFILNGKVLISGAQDSETFEQVFQQISEGKMQV